MRSPSILLVLAACIGPDDIDEANDRDNDGYEAFQAGGDDCDDSDATVHPGADEVCGNVVDDDCDGYVDDHGLGGGVFYPDSDHDEFGVTALAVEACVAPTGHVTVGGDCDDAVGTIHPEAIEIWYDGIDQDCDGADDYDQDADGFQSAEEIGGGTDCDDLDNAVHPGVTEICGNLFDDNCDGDHDDCEWANGGTVRMTRITDGTTAVLRATAGDCDEDGGAELAVWQPDAATIKLYWGSPWIEDELTPVDARLVLTMPTPQAGYGHVASLEQDISGDGGADLVVGSWKPGTAGEVNAFFELNQFLPDFDDGDADATWSAPSDGSTTVDGFGSRIVAIGAAPGATFGSIAYAYRTDTDTYRCVVHHDGPPSGSATQVESLELDPCADVVPGPLVVSGDTVVLVRVGATQRMVDTSSAVDLDPSTLPQATLWPGTVLADVLRVVGDIDGDTYGEVAAIETNSANPAVRMPYGPIDSDATPPGKWFRLEANPAVIEDFLDLNAADVNGDGLLDIVVLMDLVFTGDPGGTAVGVLFNPLQFEDRDDVDRTTFDVVLDLPSGERAMSILPADIDGDGYTDLALPGPGQVRVLYGQGR